jgi:DNA invertase Pin-like site-specific DNA recombinase
MRAALYLRVSTDDGRQNVENQRRELTEYAHRQGWRVVAIFAEQISGAAGLEDRPQLAEAFAAAARREFDVLIVFSLSRLTRGGPCEALTLIRRLRDSGVELISIAEEFLRTIGPMREAITGLLAWLHEEERRQISERVHAGLRRAKAQGKICHRPRMNIDPNEIHRMRTAGLSLKKIAAQLGISKATVARRLKENHPAAA